MQSRPNAVYLVAILIFAALPLAAQLGSGPGGIQLLPGYANHYGQGIDSTVGTISRPGGLTINYDIGEMAGVYTACTDCGWTRGELWRIRQSVNGHQVVIVKTKSNRVLISFLADYANFYATINSETDMTELLRMILTFNPLRIDANQRPTALLSR